MRFIDWYCGEAIRYLDRHMHTSPTATALPRSTIAEAAS